MRFYLWAILLWTLLATAAYGTPSVAFDRPSESPWYRADLFEPVEGVQEDTVVVLAFDTRANLDRWLDLWSAVVEQGRDPATLR